MTSRSRGQGKASPRKKRATDKRPVTDKVRFLLELDLLPRFNEAELRFRAAETALERVESHPQPEGMSVEIWERQWEVCKARLEAATQARDEAQAALDDETLVVTLQALAPKRYFDLLAEHPPTEEQVLKADEMAELAGLYEGKTEAERRRMRIDFNPDTLPRSLVAACSDLDEDELEAFFGDESSWVPADRDELFNRALAVCQRASILRR